MGDIGHLSPDWGQVHLVCGCMRCECHIPRVLKITVIESTTLTEVGKELTYGWKGRLVATVGALKMLALYVGVVGDALQKSPDAWRWYWGWELWSLFLRLRQMTKKAMIAMMTMRAITPPTTPIITKFQNYRPQETNRRRDGPPTIAPILRPPDEILLLALPVALGPFGSTSGSPVWPNNYQRLEQALALRLNLLPTDLALLSEYIPPGSVFTEH